MKVHLQIDDDPTATQDSARRIESFGADGLFTFEGPHDVFFPLVLAAGSTDLELMTNVAIAGPRSPLHLAHAAYDLQVHSRGRFRLGLGSQIKPHIERRYGAEWGKPAKRMAESVAAVKAIFGCWEGKEPLDFRGEFYTHTLMPPNFNPGPNPYGPPPILLGALGPIMTRTAGEVADVAGAQRFDETEQDAAEHGAEHKGRELDVGHVHAHRLARDLVLAHRLPGAADRQLAQALDEQIGEQGQREDQVIEKDDAMRRRVLQSEEGGKGRIVARRLERQAEEGRARNRGYPVRPAREVGPVHQDDADDLAEAERDDGEVVAAQPQHVMPDTFIVIVSMVSLL